MSIIDSIKFYANKWFKSESDKKRISHDQMRIQSRAYGKGINWKFSSGEQCEYLGCTDEAIVEMEEKQLCSIHAEALIEWVANSENNEGKR